MPLRSLLLVSGACVILSSANVALSQVPVASAAPMVRGVVDEVASPKVRYLRTPDALAMSSNWEFALSHARGEFVILMGDDDGLLPHALAELDKIIAALPELERRFAETGKVV